jgi:hypothetical protein
MTKLNVWLMVAAASLALGACNKAEKPAEVRHDVTDARADAQKDVAGAEANARKANADAQKDVADAQAKHDPNDVADETQEANQTAAKGDYKVAVAEAEATRKVEKQKCEALSGTAQSDCKQRADDAYERAKKEAEARRDSSG